MPPVCQKKLCICHRIDSCVDGAQFHLSELDKPDVLNNMLPGLGADWTGILRGSQAYVFYNLAAYIMEWEVVLARWARDDHALLQPAAPSWVLPALFCSTVMKAKIAKKELDLCAASSA